MKLLRLLLILAGGLILFLIVNQYFFCPRYSFSTPQPFSGPLFYNPYETSDSSSWKQCNFHAHVRAWGGLTNGKGTDKDCRQVYAGLGYDVYCVSNYHQVSGPREAADFIPAYEHGYNLRKNHHGILGTEKIHFGDYLLPQTLSNKQHMLDCLNEVDSSFIILNHPVLRNGFAPEDFKYLKGYDGIEVLRATTHSFPQWDSALSAGKTAFLIGNDDSHNPSNANELGRNCTWVNAAAATRVEVLAALRKGNSYGMILPFIENETITQKTERFRKGFPQLNSLQITKDTLRIRFSERADAIRLLGQQGRELVKFTSTPSAEFLLHSSDTYVRAEADFPDGSKIFLNPVYRFDPAAAELVSPRVNSTATGLMRLAGVSVFILYLFFGFRFVRRK
jgi:hypothetical protein